VSRPRLIVVGPLPPPIHGVTVSTTLVLANPYLRERFVIEHLDTSDHRDAQNVGRWDVTNIRVGIANLMRLTRMLRGSRGVLYLPISQSSGAFLRDSFFIRMANASGWRVGIHLRGSEFWRFYTRQRRPYRRWTRLTLARVSAAAVLGESLRHAFGDLVSTERIAVVPNGTPPNRAGDSIRDTRCVVFLSNLRRRKGVTEALDAALMALREVPSARVIFVGTWEDERLERDLRSAAAGMRGVEFRPSVSGSAKDELLATAGILLFPPREPEGHPRVVLEAMAAGLPVVTTDRGAIAETVRDGITGFVLPDPDPVELAGRLVSLLTDEDLYKRMSTAARSEYEAKYTQTAADARLADWLVDVATR